MNQTRRQWLGQVSFATIAASLRGTIASAQGPTESAPVYEGRRLALALVRLVNTAQQVHLKQLGRFGTLQELASPRIRSVYEESADPQLLAKIDLIRPEPVSGFEVFFDLSPDGKTYKLFVVEVTESKDRRFAYATQEDGRIREGSVAVAATINPADTFHGEPLKRSTSAPPSGIARIIASIGGFFVPTLYAGSCCSCYQGTAYDCGHDCQSNCCNVGFSDCPWCCKTWGGCGCPY